MESDDMNREQVLEIVKAARGEGKRANLQGANLQGADLSGAYLSGADLSRAVLSDADLSDADLSGADLSGADLSGADLSDADLRGAYLPSKCIQCTVDDGRNYPVTLLGAGVVQDEMLFHAGCRLFTYEDAIAHWGGNDYLDKARGAKYVATVEFLKQMAEMEG